MTSSPNLLMITSNCTIRIQAPRFTKGTLATFTTNGPDINATFFGKLVGGKPCHPWLHMLTFRKRSIGLQSTGFFLGIIMMFYYIWNKINAVIQISKTHIRKIVWSGLFTFGLYFFLWYIHYKIQHAKQQCLIDNTNTIWGNLSNSW